MAQKTNGNFDFAFNFEVNLEGPLDARLTVENLSDLDTVPMKYDGMVVSVVDDTTLDNNGVYYYLDSSSSWSKLLDSGDQSVEPSAIVDGDSDITVVDGDPDTIQITVDNTHCWSFNRYGHLLPVSNNSYDIGSASRKVRHMYLSPNSLWIGELNKITIDPNTAELKFQKRDASVIPPALVNLGLDETAILARTGSSSLSEVTLAEYKSLAENEGIGIDDLFPSEDSSAFSTSKTLSRVESGITKSDIDIDASTTTIDITARLADADSGIFIIKDASNPIIVDLTSITKTESTDCFEIYHQAQSSFSITCSKGSAYSVFEQALQTSIDAAQGQFIKLWYNSSSSRWEYLYRSI